VSQYTAVPQRRHGSSTSIDRLVHDHPAGGRPRARVRLHPCVARQGDELNSYPCTAGNRLPQASAARWEALMGTSRRPGASPHYPLAGVVDVPALD
jgi:hypothetical protein